VGCIEDGVALVAHARIALDAAHCLRRLLTLWRVPDAQPVQLGTAGVLPTQLFGVLAVIGELVVVMVPPMR
jgi:hypothetical protein